MPAPAMMMGTIIGEIKSAVSVRRQGMAGLERPRAARVPKVVASKVAAMPMTAVFLAANCQRSPSSTCSYQRRE